ncbi:hypothetical protein MHT86_06350 [Corynebacterium mastitidis]|nr:hypothetical protein [Corynebacterium mastitidis]MCH6197116.1 hypothetical protein [Corynebacterium mastitidis]
MSDEEKQLTVAELLERAQANRGSAQRTSGRRRRRSLEDGGISVAELTGSLSRVKEKPAESKHSSVPIDTPESERRSRPRTPSSPAATAPSVAGINATPLSGASFKPAAASPAAWGAPQQGPATPKSGQPTRPGVAPAAKGSPAAPARPVKAAAAAPAPAAKPEPEKKNAPAAPTAPAKQQPQRPAQDKAQAPQSAQLIQGTQDSANKSPWPIPDSARRAAPAPRPAAAPAKGAAAAPKPKAAASPESAKESASEKTAVISPVGGTPQAEKKQAKEKPAEETGRIPRVGDEDSAPVASLYQNAQQRPAEADAERGEREGSAEDAAPKKRPKRPAEPEPRTGAGSAVLLAVMGVVFGALVFIGFDQLWSSGLSRILVGVLAVAVTGIMVGVVHALRTARDGVSMALAAVVGVLMTFGPYIPHMLS